MNPLINQGPAFEKKPESQTGIPVGMLGKMMGARLKVKAPSKIVTRSAVKIKHKKVKFY